MRFAAGQRSRSAAVSRSRERELQVMDSPLRRGLWLAASILVVWAALMTQNIDAQESAGQESATQEIVGGEVADVHPPAGPLAGTEALREGNRLFAEGRLDAALDAYRAGYRPEMWHPTLIYNMATTLHHLERLPEAILWYRRGDAEDPWLQENLWLARRSLGSQRLSVSGFAAVLAQHSGSVFAVAVVLAWLSLLAALWPRAPRLAWASALALALLLWLGSWLMARSAPREAVLLADCATATGELPAGTELWLWPSAGEELAVVGFAETFCPGEAVGWIEH